VANRTRHEPAAERRRRVVPSQEAKLRASAAFGRGVPSPHSLDARAVLRLQRLAGNHAVATHLAAGATPPLAVQRGRSTEIRHNVKAAKVFKIVIAGSGDDAWRPKIGNAEKLSAFDEPDESKSKNSPTFMTKTGKHEVMFAGPGASTTKKRSWLGGAKDQGSNEIKRLVATVPGIVRPMIEQCRNEGGPGLNENLHILIKAHSRGSVAASQIARQLLADFHGANVELVMFDPVPGPGHKGASTKIDLSASGLSEFTLVYSVASGYLSGFTPQSVLGAKRIIISAQNHSAGLVHGFRYGGLQYKAGRLNSLPPGVYVDRKKKDQDDRAIQLEKVDDIDGAKQKFKAAFKGRGRKSSDRGRRKIVTNILDDYYR